MSERYLVRAPTGCHHSEQKALAENSNVANDHSVQTIKVSNLCSACSAVGKPSGAGRGALFKVLNEKLFQQELTKRSDVVIR